MTAKIQQKQNAEYLSEITPAQEAWQQQLEKEANSTMKPIRPQYIMKVLTEKNR